MHHLSPGPSHQGPAIMDWGLQPGTGHTPHMLTLMIIDSVTHILRTLSPDIDNTRLLITLTMLQESPLQPPVPECGGPPARRVWPRPRAPLLLTQGPHGQQWSPGDQGQTALPHLPDGGPGPQHQPVQPGALHQPEPPVP